MFGRYTRFKNYMIDEKYCSCTEQHEKGEYYKGLSFVIYKKLLYIGTLKKKIIDIGSYFSIMSPKI